MRTTAQIKQGLLQLMNEVRAEEAAMKTGEYPWQREIRERREQRRGD